MTNMGSIFDIEEKSNKEIDETYLISNGWELKDTSRFGVVYIKTIHQKNRPKRFISFCYYLDTPNPMLRNMNTSAAIEVYKIIDLEIMVNKWITDWENIYKQFFI